MNKILLVEDDENFGSLLMNYLELSNFEVQWLKNGSQAYSVLMQSKFDLCIFDVMMPEMDGITLAKKIKPKINTPIFFLTAKNRKEDIIAGYQSGVDDYLVKPFDTEVLLLKIKAIINRSDKGRTKLNKKEYQIGEFDFVPLKRQLIHRENHKKLSPKESALLELLCEYLNDIMPRAEALETIWEQNDYFTKRSMDVYIGKLRKYLKADKNVSIETFHQVGFQLRVDE